MGCVLPSTPFDLVDLLFYFKGLEVVELGLVRLKLSMEFVLACLFLLDISSIPRMVDVQPRLDPLGEHCQLLYSQFRSSQRGPPDRPCRLLPGNSQYGRTRLSI